MQKHRIAVVSPTIDKCHGTERRVAECVSRLSADDEVHVYSKRVDDIELAAIHWHRIPDIPGPYLLRYLWWLAANHLWRRWDSSFRGLKYDLVYSPGINCIDADVVTVHVLFSEYRRWVGDELRFAKNPVRSWPRLIHRRLCHALITALERRIYSRPSLTLGAVSKQVAENLRHHFGRTAPVRIVYQGTDFDVFNPEARCQRRLEIRRQLGLTAGDFALLLIGNDWKTKGLRCLLEAISELSGLRLRLLVVGTDDRRPFEVLAEHLGIAGRVQFLNPSKDVIGFYAAADAYVGPSLHDSFAMPPSEAMACGLPVITSSANGGSEMITDQEDGLILQDPKDSHALAQLIKLLYHDCDLRRRLGENALRTARGYTWERNAHELRELFQEVLNRKGTEKAEKVKHWKLESKN